MDLPQSGNPCPKLTALYFIASGVNSAQIESLRVEIRFDALSPLGPRLLWIEY